MGCKNCNTELDTQQNYCHHCGAKVIRNRLTVRNLSEDINDQFLNIDNKFLRTFIDLCRKPDAVIDGYIRGTRKKYINVIQYLAISLTFLGAQIFILKTFFPEYLNMPIDEEVLALYPESTRENMVTFLSQTNDFLSLYYIFGIPFSALITWILFIKEKRYNFIEHVVINIYITAQYVFVSVVLNLLFASFDASYMVAFTIPSLMYIFYFGFVLYKLYDVDVGIIILRFFLSLMLFAVLMIVLTIFIAILTLIYLKLIKPYL